MNNRLRYPLRSNVDKADRIIRETADLYNLSLVQIMGHGETGPGRRKCKGGLVYVARVEAARRCLGECVRPAHLAVALGISERRVHYYYGLLRRNGFGPLCMRRAS
jgi:hypothetical protein